MAYTTIQLVRDATGFASGSKIADSYITAKISYADGLINSAMAERYVLPFDSTPDSVAFLSLEITVAILFMEQYGEEAEDTDKGWEKRINFLMKQLELYRTGKLKLIDPTTGVELPRSSARLPSSYPTAASSDPTSVPSTAAQVEIQEKW